MEQTQAPTGAEVLAHVRELFSEPRGLLHGRGPRFRLVAGLVIGALGIVTVITAYVRGIVTIGTLESPEVGIPLAIGVFVTCGGGVVAVGALTRGARHAVGRVFTKVTVAVAWVAGVLGAALSVAASGFLVYGLTVQQTFARDHPELTAQLLSTQVMALLLALFCVLELTPVVSADLRSGAERSLWRVRLMAANVVGVGVGMVALLSRSSALSDFVPAALAATIVTTAGVKLAALRRRLEQVQREAAERFTDLALAAREARSEGSGGPSGAGRSRLLTGLARAEDYLAPTNETPRVVSVLRSDSDTLGFVRYCAGRVDARFGAFLDDARFSILRRLTEQELVAVIEDVALTYRAHLLHGRLGDRAGRRAPRPADASQRIRDAIPVGRGSG